VIRKVVRLPNKLGLHMRAANIFVDSASRFASAIQVGRGEVIVNGKSIMGLMMLAAGCGTELVIETKGADEQAAMSELVELVRTGFGEEMAEEPEDVP
jgi:phosphocarrier protein